MEKIRITLMLLMIAAACHAQTARQVLDKTAAIVSAKNGVQANFSIKSSKGANLNTSGTIVVKGKKFHTTTPQAIVWFDGKTMWTYITKNDEVNVSTPTESQLATINPYNFINMYKQGYGYTMEKVRNNYVVRLIAKDKKKTIQDISITIQQKSYIPFHITYRTAKGVTTIDISNFKATAQSDDQFRFNPKAYPKAEIIDLR